MVCSVVAHETRRTNTLAETSGMYLFWKSGVSVPDSESYVFKPFPHSVRYNTC